MAILLWWVMGGYFINAQTLDARVQRKLAELERKGVPTTQEALWRKVKAVSAEDNAAPLLLEAGAKLVVPDKKDVRLPYFSGAYTLPSDRLLTQEDLDYIQAWLGKNEEALKVLSAALLKPACLFLKHGSTLTHTNDYSYYKEVKSLAQLLALKSYWQAGRGDVTGAIDSIAGVLKVGDFLRNEPNMLSYPLRLSIDSTAMSAASQLLGRRVLNTDELNRLTGLFSWKPHTTQLQLGLAADMVLSIPLMRLGAEDFISSVDAINEAISGEPQTPMPPLSMALVRANWEKGLNHADSSMFVEQMGLLIEAAGKSFDDGLSMAETTKVKREEAFKKRFLLTAIFTPALTQMISRQAESVTRQRLLLSVIAIEQHRLNNGGQPPVSLGSLAQGKDRANYEDPFAGKLFCYSKLEKGYKIYSVGPDRKDDKGVKKAEAGEGKTYDIGIKMPR